MISIFKKEIGTFFNSLIGYIVIAVFLLLSGLFMWLYPSSNILDYGYAEMITFFEFCPYIFLFLIPAITMRMFAEEARTGTIELLFTKPISVLDVILGKYLASIWIVVLALIPTLIYYISIYFLGNPEGNIDSAAVFGSYFGLVFLAAAYTAIGIFTSSITKSQVVAFVIAGILCYLFYEGVGQIAQLFSGSIQFYLDYVGLSFHYNALGKGVLDTRNIIYLLSFSLLFLLLTRWSLIKRRK